MENTVSLIQEPKYLEWIWVWRRTRKVSWLVAWTVFRTFPVLRSVSGVKWGFNHKLSCNLKPLLYMFLSWNLVFYNLEFWHILTQKWDFSFSPHQTQTVSREFMINHRVYLGLLVIYQLYRHGIYKTDSSNRKLQIQSILN